MASQTQPSILLTTPDLEAGRPASPAGSSIFDLPTHPGTSTGGMVTRHPSNDNVQASSAGNEHTESADPSFVIVSGGTGCNAICSAFSNACYVLPVSDDGGSSSEIIRVLGGPSIGRDSYHYMKST